MQSEQAVFCGICLDSKQPDDIYSFSGCGHAFCRECLQAYASGAIAAKTYPVR